MLRRRGLRELLVGLVALVACSRPAPPPTAVRLVDLFGQATVEGSVGAPGEMPETPLTSPSEWRFDQAGEPSWKAVAGVAGLRLKRGSLAGRASTGLPILGVEWSQGLSDPDVLHSVVVRARVSAGTRLSVTFDDDVELDREELLEDAERFPWPLATPLLPGIEVQTYRILAASAARTSFPASRMRHVLLRPTDVEGAEFAIESVRLVFRRQHLAGIAAGVGWQGLSETYRESIVTRAPELVRFELELPARPLLDLALGTVEEGPVGFRVAVSDAAALGAGERVLIERTVTTPHRWEEVMVDLGDLAGERVVLTLSLEAEEGRIGLWGAPAIRSRTAGREARPRGVILILLDTLRSDHLAAYGYERETAPAVSRLAREGALFRDAIAQGSWTKVSVPSMLSSTYPSSNGIFEMFHRLPASASTLAEAFREGGYATWGGSASAFSGRANNLHQGLEVLHERGSLEVPEGQSRSKTARLLVDRLLPWLASHREVPFFVFLHPLDPHSPYEPYPPFDARWAGPDAKARHQEYSERVRPLVRRLRRNGNLPLRPDLLAAGVDPEEFVRIELDWYDGSTLGADVEIRRVLEKLRELDLEEATLVVFVSDHGEEFLDHGGHFHEDNVYGELVNVPLILRWPGGIPAGLVVEETVQLLDVAPTLLELAGMPVPARMQGTSLVPLLSAPEAARFTGRPAVSEWKRRSDQRDRGVDSSSIIADGYKLIHNRSPPDGHPELELYDHGLDPLDQYDLAAAYPEVVERLAKRLADWQLWALGNALPADAEAATGLDAEELERLRSLGYLE